MACRAHPVTMSDEAIERDVVETRVQTIRVWRDAAGDWRATFRTAGGEVKSSYHERDGLLHAVYHDDGYGRREEWTRVRVPLRMLLMGWRRRVDPAWYCSGSRHREDGPAYVEERFEGWFRDGLRHRV